MIASRLSDMSIGDDILRVELYKGILAYLNNAANMDSFIVYEVKEDEETRPDLLSHRVFKTSELSWLVMLVAGVDDPFDSLPVGYELEFPPMAIVRSMIREVRESAS